MSSTAEYFKQLIPEYCFAPIDTPDGKMHEFKPSYVLIASMADCKIVPIITDGNYGIFKSVSVIIGEEFHLSEILGKDTTVLTKEDINVANEKIHAKAMALRQKLEEIKEARKK